MNRSIETNTLRAWALALKERLGFKRAAVTLARKLAVIVHTMLKPHPAAINFASNA
ncbi:hypothetical protein [Novosphingobium sp. M1R2S20]|uniref:Transposase n=1 Tax=Novosphingobium rhizovicinum TaxID=3228928 RepID=A0ABV3R6U4_9SPHN